MTIIKSTPGKRIFPTLTPITSIKINLAIRDKNNNTILILTELCNLNLIPNQIYCPSKEICFIVNSHSLIYRSKYSILYP